MWEPTEGSIFEGPLSLPENCLIHLLTELKMRTLLHIAVLFGTALSLTRAQSYSYTMDVFRRIGDDAITSILKDEFLPGYYVMTNGYVIYIAQENAGTVDPIAGGSYQGTQYKGYIEGYSTNIRFDYVSDMLFLDNSTLLVSDTNNNCLRVIDRATNQSRTFAGTCTQAGYKDGELAVAQLNLPAGLTRMGSRMYVADTGSNAIREFDEYFMTTYIQTLKPMYISLDPTFTHMYISNKDNDMSVVDMAAHTVERMNLTSFDWGRATKKYLQSPKGVLALKDGLVLVADRSNHLIRVIDVYFKRVETICDGVGSTSPGSIIACSIYLPHSFAVTDDKRLLIGSEDYLRDIDSQAIIDLAFPHVNNCPDDAKIILRLSPVQQSLQYTWTLPVVANYQPRIPATCSICPINTRKLLAGIHKIVYKFSNAHLDTYCQFTITVLPDGQGKIGTEADSAHESADMVCPSDYSIVLPPATSSIQTSWQMPRYSQSYSCVDCPPTSATLRVGHSNFTYVYKDSNTGDLIRCTFNIDIKSGSSNIPRHLCNGEGSTFYVSSNADMALVAFPVDPVSGFNRTIRLPVGEYLSPLNTPSGICLGTYKVIAGAGITQPVSLTKYKVAYRIPKCDSISDLAFTVIDSVLQQHTTQIKNFCSCRNVTMFRNCTSADELGVTWETDRKYPDYLGDVAKEEERLRVYQHHAQKVAGQFMDLTVITMTPAQVKPLIQKNGMMLMMQEYFGCSNDDDAFDPVSTSCLQKKN